MPPRSILRVLGTPIKPNSCIFCQTKHFMRPLYQARNLPDPYRKPKAGTPPPSRSASKTEAEKRAQFALDKKTRGHVYAISRSLGHIKLEPEQAENFIRDFLRGDTSVEKLAERYSLQLSQVTELAIPLLTAGGGKTSTYNTDIAYALLRACSNAGDALATLHIMASHYIALSHGQKSAVSKSIPPSALATARSHLEQLAKEENNPDAMTLLAQYLELESKPDEAKALYTQAMQLWTVESKKNTATPMAPRISTPWAAYGTLLLRTDKNTALAAEIFKKGAQEADDPICHYNLSLLLPPSSVEWLTHTSCAAASGHPIAQFRLGNFYFNTNRTPSPSLKKALQWLKPAQSSTPSALPGTSAALGWEWHDVAAKNGYKPSMLKLAEWMIENGVYDGAGVWIEKAMVPGASALVTTAEDAVFVKAAKLLAKRLRMKGPEGEKALREISAAYRKPGGGDVGTRM